MTNINILSMTNSDEKSPGSLYMKHKVTNDLVN